MLLQAVNCTGYRLIRRTLIGSWLYFAFWNKKRLVLSWGRNAWRTPKNVCVGDYTKLWEAMNVQDLIQFHQSTSVKSHSTILQRPRRQISLDYYTIPPATQATLSSTTEHHFNRDIYFLNPSLQQPLCPRQNIAWQYNVTDIISNQKFQKLSLSAYKTRQGQFSCLKYCLITVTLFLKNLAKKIKFQFSHFCLILHLKSF